MTKFSVRSPLTVFVVSLLLVLAGFSSYLSLPREDSPEIKIPLIFVSTVYPGASPENIESLVTRKIEDKLDGLDGVKKLSSQSMDGVSMIQVEFDPNIEVEMALRRVKDKVDEAKGDLPSDAEDPMVQELNFSNIPIFVMSLTADYELEKLEEVAESLKEKLAKVGGVLEVKVTGKQVKEVAIDVDPHRLKAYDLNLGELAGAIQRQHGSIPGGVLENGVNRFSVQITGEVSKVEDFKDLVVRSKEGQNVYLRDVAEVSLKWSRNRSSISRLDGGEALTIMVTKRTGENIIRLVDDAKVLIDELEPTMPAGTHIEYVLDKSKDIRHMVNELVNHIISGIILVVLILSLFLGVRNSFFISLAIPISMLLGFLVLDAMGVTLNMVVLFSLVIALGMLVDDGIVVVENIYRHYQMGKTRVQSAIDGTKEVMLPVTTATITTIVAFLPILWMPGIMGGFMKYLPITISVTLTASLFVAFIVNPMLASLFMTREDATEADEEKGLFGILKRAYSSSLETLLSNPKKGLISTGILTVLSFVFVFGGIAFFGALGKGVEFFPNIEPKIVAVTVEGPVGQSLEQTNQALLKLEKVILNIPEEYGDVKNVTTVVGRAKAEMGGTSQAESHKGYLDITFTDYEDRKVPSWITMDWLRENVGDMLPAWEVVIKKQEEGPPQGYPVSYEIVGDEYAVLAPLADSLKKQLAKIPGLINVNTDFDPARPEMRVDVNRDHASRLGVSNTQVAQAVRGALYGVDAGNFRKGDDEYDIMVRFSPEYRESMEVMREVGLSLDKGKKVPLSSVAKVSQGAALASINHIGGNRTIQVWGEAAPGLTDQQSLKTKAMEIVKAFDVPPGYSILVGTSNKEQEDTTAFLLKAFLVTVALVFVTMLFQFNSISQPMLVVFGIFLSLGGVFWGMTFVQLPFSIIMTGIGIISLAGIVAKNGIVLIDFINQLRMEGVELQRAVIEGGVTRLRPILLTAITAMISLIPMATGVGFDFTHFELVTRSETSLWWAPMAWAIFWGLAFNTVLVLVMIPVLYYAYELLRERFTKKERYATKAE